MQAPALEWRPFRLQLVAHSSLFSFPISSLNCSLFDSFRSETKRSVREKITRQIKAKHLHVFTLLQYFHSLLNLPLFRHQTNLLKTLLQMSNKCLGSFFTFFSNDSSNKKNNFSSQMKRMNVSVGKRD